MAARTSPEAEQRILALWGDGEVNTTRRIAEAIGVSQTTVRRVLERHGLPVAPEGVRRFPRRTTPSQDAEIVRRYLAGEPAKALAQEFGLAFHISVIQRVRAAGFEARKPGPPFRDIPADLGEEILRLRNDEGLSQEAISRSLGIAQARVSRYLVANGHRTWPLSRHPQFNGVIKNQGGYILRKVPDDDPLRTMAPLNGYILEHRYVMAQALGRPLGKHETVHHINGDKADNRLENLQLRIGNHGKGISLACLDCGSHNVGAVPL